MKHFNYWVLTASLVSKGWFTVVRIADFLLLTYVNEYGNLRIGEILDCHCNGIEITQSHRAEDIADSYDNCEPGFIVQYGLLSGEFSYKYLFS